MNTGKKYVINSYSPSKYSSGLADFIKGTATLLRLFDNTDIDVCVDYTSHPISNFLYSDHYYKEEEPYDYLNKIICHNTIRTHLEACDKAVRITTNYCVWPFELTDTQKQIIKEMFLPKEDFLRYINKQREVLTKDYTTLHIRTGDLHFNSSKKDIKIFIPQIKRFIDRHNTEMSLFITSDNYHIKKELTDAYDFVYCLDSTPIHLGTLLPNTNDILKVVRDTLCDFYIMIGSKNTACFSSYGPGTSFTHLCSAVFDVPCIFNEELKV